MAARTKALPALLMAAAVVAASCSAASAQQSGCTAALLSLLPCLTYVQGSVATPSSSCCTQLTAVVQSQVQCLCQVLNSSGGTVMGFAINQTNALALPGACNVKTPSPELCNATAAGPAAPPAAAPPTSPPTTPTTPSVPLPPSIPTIQAPPSPPATPTSTVPQTPPFPSGSGKTTSAASSAGIPLSGVIAFLFAGASYAI